MHPALEPMKVKCLVDTGSTYLVIPQHIATALRLQVLQNKEATTADGKQHFAPYAGPVQVSFENRHCFVGALILGNEVLLGAVAMEDMDLVVNPKLFTLSANPESPDVPRGYVK